jgi:hypothetical protein
MNDSSDLSHTASEEDFSGDIDHPKDVACYKETRTRKGGRIIALRGDLQRNAALTEIRTSTTKLFKGTNKNLGPLGSMGVIIGSSERTSDEINSPMGTHSSRQELIYSKSMVAGERHLHRLSHHSFRSKTSTLHFG